MEHEMLLRAMKRSRDVDGSTLPNVACRPKLLPLSAPASAAHVLIIGEKHSRDADARGNRSVIKDVGALVCTSEPTELKMMRRMMMLIAGAWTHTLCHPRSSHLVE